MHRMAYTASWVLFLDFDEFMYTYPPTSFLSVLREAQGVPYITFGSLWWSVYLCRYVLYCTLYFTVLYLSV